VSIIASNKNNTTVYPYINVTKNVRKPPCMKLVLTLGTLYKNIYIHTYSLHGAESFFRSLTGFWACQEIPRILWNLKVHYRIHKCPPPVPIRNTIYPIHFKIINIPSFQNISLLTFRQLQCVAQTLVEITNFALITSEYNTMELRKILNGLFIAYSSSNHTSKRTNNVIFDVTCRCLKAHMKHKTHSLSKHHRLYISKHQRQHRPSTTSLYKPGITEPQPIYNSCISRSLKILKHTNLSKTFEKLLPYVPL